MLCLQKCGPPVQFGEAQGGQEVEEGQRREDEAELLFDAFWLVWLFVLFFQKKSGGLVVEFVGWFLGVWIWRKTYTPA